MKIQIYSMILTVLLIFGMTPPQLLAQASQTAEAKKTDNMFRLFRPAASGQSGINAYILSALSCYMYPERLAYAFRDGQERTTDSDLEFERVYQATFSRWFYNPVPPTPPTEPTKPAFSFSPLEVKPQIAELRKGKYKVIKLLPALHPKAEKNPENTTAEYQKAYAAYERKYEAWKNSQPEFKYIRKANSGTDPEAMVISTPTTVLVVFRGTDRVASAIPQIREYSEWLETNFNLGPISPDTKSLNGKVHKGFWNSVKAIRGTLKEEIEESNGQNKKVWITGHSLGAAQAIVFAMYLQHSASIRVQGVYGFGSPSCVGNQDFAAQINDTFGDRYQRFEYRHDIVTSLPMDVVPLAGYTKAGIRNWYDQDERFFYNRGERTLTFDNGYVPIVGQKILSGRPAGGCEHNPEWYVRAAYSLIERTNPGILDSLYVAVKPNRGSQYVMASGQKEYVFGACQDY